MYGLLRPLIFLLDPERAHGISLWALKHGIVPGPGSIHHPALSQSLWGLEFPNPVGLAAGFDKDAKVPIKALNLGFGFVELGSVTPKPQRGNPRPRLFRLSSDDAAINRNGFNSIGMELVAQNLAKLTNKRTGPIGVNLGKNKETKDAVSDYVASIQSLGPFADYLVVNVSSPNTPGLRALQGKEPLKLLLSGVREAIEQLDRHPPLLLKVAPDLTDDDKRDIAVVALDENLDGIIATNTTTARPDSLIDPKRTEIGGLSGKPLMEASTKVLADLFHLTEGRIPLVGVGGVASAEDAYAKIRAGASLVQLYTAMVYEGPHVVININRGLVEHLHRDGFAHLTDAIGAEHR